MPTRVSAVNRCTQGAIAHAIDSPRLGDRDVSANELSIVGWAVSTKIPIRRIVIRGDGRELGSVTQTITRPKVQQRFAGRFGADRAGFKAVVDARGVSELMISAELDNGDEQRLSSIQLAQDEPKQIFYFHVAKTAGSSVNQYVTQHLRSSDWATHLESVPNWRASSDVLRRHFLSGHLRYEVIRDQLDLSSFLTVATFRRPIEHVVSHLAWLRRLAEPGHEAEYAARTESIKALIHQLARMDLSSPAELAEMVSGLDAQQLNLIDNTQTRYVCRKQVSPRVGLAEAHSALENLKQIDIVGTAEQLGQVLARIAAAMGWAPPDNEPRENVQATKYGLDAGDPDTRTALLPIIEHDEVVYQAACQLSGAGEP